jgi:preprotein translocase subunit YajC
MSIQSREAVMGTTIVVILLVPLMFQVFMMRQEQRKRHEEIQGRLDLIEKKLTDR